MLQIGLKSLVVTSTDREVPRLFAPGRRNRRLIGGTPVPAPPTSSPTPPPGPCSPGGIGQWNIIDPGNPTGCEFTVQ